MKSLTLLTATSLSFALAAPIMRAEYLYNSYLVPGFDGNPNTEHSQWDVFYSPNGGENYPDIAAPNGTYQTASAAGFTPPGDSSPADPQAFWHLDNATITQTNGGHFIIGPGTAGSIYSFAVPSFYVVNDTTPYVLGTAVFQFQTEGTGVDFDSIKLVYSDGIDDVELAPTDYIREYKAGASAFGGIGNRNALQWDLTGFGVTSYQITFNSPSSSMSFQQAVLDTAATFEAVVPGSRTWNGVGAQTWSVGTNWQEGSTSVANGNVRFENAADATITLDGNRTVAEVTFDTTADVSITGESKLTANTGITTTATATGDYTIGTAYEMGAFNVFDIGAGKVTLAGVVTGTYGLIKTGDGTLMFANNNTFGTATSGLGVQGGTLRVEGTNAYGGSSSVLFGRLEVAADAPSGSSGALGNATSSVLVGASSSTFSGITEPAQLVVSGNHTIARNVTVELGTFEKRLGGTDTNGEAVFSGNVSLLGTTTGGSPTATNVHLFAQEASDVVRFSGNISGGVASRTVTINGHGEQGTVIYSGSNKTYNNSTVVSAGTLIVASGTTTGNGNWSVSSGAELVVNSTIAGTGSFMLQGELSGSGIVNRTVVTSGPGATISAGNSPGTLTVAGLNLNSGANFVFELGTTSDLIDVNGLLTGSAAAGGLLFSFLDSGGLAIGVTYTLFNYDGLSGLEVTDFTVASPGFTVSEWTIGGGQVQVEFSAVPEPGTAALVWAGLVVMAFLRRRARS